jgi:hypothetical protein
VYTRSVAHVMLTLDCTDACTRWKAVIVTAAAEEADRHEPPANDADTLYTPFSVGTSEMVAVPAASVVPDTELTAPDGEVILNATAAPATAPDGLTVRVRVELIEIEPATTASDGAATADKAVAAGPTVSELELTSARRAPLRSAKNEPSDKNAALAVNEPAFANTTCTLATPALSVVAVWSGIAPPNEKRTG